MEQLNFNYKNDNYTLDFNEESKTLTITKNYISAIYKLNENHGEYFYQIKKSQVNCHTINALYKHFNRYIASNDAASSLCIGVIENIMKIVKPVKASA